MKTFIEGLLTLLMVQMFIIIVAGLIIGLPVSLLIVLGFLHLMVIGILAPLTRRR